MRPRTLKRRLILAGLGGMLAATTITTGIARADTTDVCSALADSPTVGTVEQLVFEFMGDGLTPGDAGEAIAITVMARCPEYRPVLQRFIAAYTNVGQVRA